MTGAAEKGTYELVRAPLLKCLRFFAWVSGNGLQAAPGFKE
jgi:hypothetical protein